MAGPIDVAASAGRGTMSADDSTTAWDPASYSFGQSLGCGQINVSAAYAGAEDDPALGDMSSFTVGATYTPGPWKIAVTGFSSERDGSATATAGGAGPREASVNTVQLKGGCTRPGRRRRRRARLGETPGRQRPGRRQRSDLRRDDGAPLPLSRRLSTGVGAVTSASPTPDSGPAATASISHRPSANRARRRCRHTVTPSPRMTITTRDPATHQDDD